MTLKTKSKPRKLLLIALALIAVVVVALVLLRVTRPSRLVSSIPEVLDSQMTYEVVWVYPHDPGAFTQGLIYLDGFLYESTGLYGQSSLRKVDLETGAVLQEVALPAEVFGEGLTDWEQTLVQLTWREGTGYIYDRLDFSLLGDFSYETEGWGITRLGDQLVMSDGTATLYLLDPESFAVEDTVTVTYAGEDIPLLNELEVVQGEIFANIWKTDDIIRIDPGTGAVSGWIDLSGILPQEERTPETNVLNGIAYDPETDRLFITGKLWPALYEIRLVPVGLEE